MPPKKARTERANRPQPPSGTAATVATTSNTTIPSSTTVEDLARSLVTARRKIDVDVAIADQVFYMQHDHEQDHLDCHVIFFQLFDIFDEIEAPAGTLENYESLCKKLKYRAPSIDRGNYNNLKIFCELSLKLIQSLESHRSSLIARQAKGHEEDRAVWIDWKTRLIDDIYKGKDTRPLNVIARLEYGLPKKEDIEVINSEVNDLQTKMEKAAQVEQEWLRYTQPDDGFTILGRYVNQIRIRDLELAKKVSQENELRLREEAIGAGRGPAKGLGTLKFYVPIQVFRAINQQHNILLDPEERKSAAKIVKDAFFRHPLVATNQIYAQRYPAATSLASRSQEAELKYALTMLLRTDAIFIAERDELREKHKAKKSAKAALMHSVREFENITRQKEAKFYEDQWERRRQAWEEREKEAASQVVEDPAKAAARERRRRRRAALGQTVEEWRKQSQELEMEKKQHRIVEDARAALLRHQANENTAELIQANEERVIRQRRRWDELEAKRAEEGKKREEMELQQKKGRKRGERRYKQPPAPLSQYTSDWLRDTPVPSGSREARLANRQMLEENLVVFQTYLADAMEPYVDPEEKRNKLAKLFYQVFRTKLQIVAEYLPGIWQTLKIMNDANKEYKKRISAAKEIETFCSLIFTLQDMSPPIPETYNFLTKFLSFQHRMAQLVLHIDPRHRVTPQLAYDLRKTEWWEANMTRQQYKIPREIHKDYFLFPPLIDDIKLQSNMDLTSAERREVAKWASTLVPNPAIPAHQAQVIGLVQDMRQDLLRESQDTLQARIPASQVDPWKSRFANEALRNPSVPSSRRSSSASLSHSLSRSSLAVIPASRSSKNKRALSSSPTRRGRSDTVPEHNGPRDFRTLSDPRLYGREPSIGRFSSRTSQTSSRAPSVSASVRSFRGESKWNSLKRVTTKLLHLEAKLNPNQYLVQYGYNQQHSSIPVEF